MKKEKNIFVMISLHECKNTLSWVERVGRNLWDFHKARWWYLISGLFWKINVRWEVTRASTSAKEWPPGRLWLMANNMKRALSRRDFIKQVEDYTLPFIWRKKCTVYIKSYGRRLFVSKNQKWLILEIEWRMMNLTIGENGLLKKFRKHQFDDAFAKYKLSW